MSFRRNRFSGNNFILFIYIIFTILFVILWMYELFISKKYGMVTLLTFWEIVFTIAYMLFVRE